MVRRTSFIFSAAFLIPALWIQPTNAGNTTCASSQLDWYSSVVGESPCVTYQRLRRICNNDYQVPNFRPTTPGDQCDDQVSECCCNTVAFQLSMLCMNIGAYTLYRGNCGAATNNSLPKDIQTAACNLDIRLDNVVYRGWADGSWFYVWTKENSERDHVVNNNNTFTHCANQISPSPIPTPPSTSTVADVTTTTSSQTSSSSSVPVQTAADNRETGSNDSHSHIGATIGGVVGGVGAIVIIGGAIIIWRMRRNPNGATPVIRDRHYSHMHQDTSPVGSVTPFAVNMTAVPVVGLTRSPSDRHPPSYHSREVDRIVSFSTGFASVATTDPGYSETQPFGPLARTAPNSCASPPSLEPHRHMPLVPLRRTSVEKRLS